MFGNNRQHRITSKLTMGVPRSRWLQAARQALLAPVCLVSACGTPPTPAIPHYPIDRSISAISQDSRVRHIVIHYTSAGNSRSLQLLSRHNVSSHYLVTDESPPRIYQLVDEQDRAWHAGISQWYGRTYLNSSSIGIEIVNQGSDNTQRYPYPPEQIDAVIHLAKAIAKRHAIEPQNIVGHSDIAPQRKRDPGPDFPWEALARAGLGRWPDSTLTEHYRLEFELRGLPGTQWAQEQLDRLGYAVPMHGQLDAETRNVISAFQMHYRPARHDGHMDTETAAILKALP